jgi:M6 family metalloprotease-like protein
MAPSAGFTGQMWTVDRRPDGTCRLTNEFTGPQRFLGLDRETNRLTIAAGHRPEHDWVLTDVGDVAGEAPAPGVIPQLDPGGWVDLTEGPGDYRRCLLPVGTLTAVMVFVDFDDVEAGYTSAAATGDHLLGSGDAQRLFHEQSDGRLGLEVTVRSDLGWRRMPGLSTAYSFGETEPHRAFIAAAAGLFRPSEINFPEYDIVFVVAAKTEQFPLSPAFPHGSDEGAAAPGGRIHHAVTFGADSYRNSHLNLVHEVGHLLGLPDLYPLHGGNDEVGCWEIMSDIFHARSFCGWHRHKNGWLDASRKTYVADDRHGWVTKLHPLSGPDGLSMIVLPVDDPLRPGKVLVVEPAQPVLGTDRSLRGEGILVYSVDATIPSGSSPVVVIPRQTGTDGPFGYLFDAPYGVGDVAEVSEKSGAWLRVAVRSRRADAYEVELSYRPPH